MPATISSPPSGVWTELDVALGEARYKYHFGADCLDRITWQLGRYEADRFLVITDDTVLGLHGDRLLPELAKYAPVEEMSLPPGEDIKTLGALARHLEYAVEAGATRRSVVVSFGGGVPGNLAGLVAGMLFRGVRLTHIPTTTIAAMDSVLSLKQTVNSQRGKNHFGIYHPPHAVFADVRLMQTLPTTELRSGLCETTKNCLAIRPAALPALSGILQSGAWAAQDTLFWLLRESLAAKMQVTAADMKEQRAGLVLEYGHTIGHALELCDHRLRGAEGVSHGEAVAMGMRVAARISAAMGLLSTADRLLHDDLASALGVPSVLPGISADEVLAVVRMDNKRGYIDLTASQAAMVLLQAPGKPLGIRDLPLVPVGMDLIRQHVADVLTADTVRC